MIPVLAAFDAVLAALRLVLFALAVVLFIVFAVDWLVRTRRLNPFGPVARFVRRTVDPMILPVERRIVRAGGLPTSAPWWALVAVVVGGILLILALEFVRDLVLVALSAAGRGPHALYGLLVSWTFGILKLALIVRVIASWLQVSLYRPWIRWSRSWCAGRRCGSPFACVRARPAPRWAGRTGMPWWCVSRRPRWTGPRTRRWSQRWPADWACPEVRSAS